MQRPLEDDDWFRQWDGRLLLVIAEVKTGECALNGPWTNSERRNVQRVLAAVGIHSPDERDRVAEDLYNSGIHSDGNEVAALVVFGDRQSTRLRQVYPAVPQILWRQVKSFIHKRFSNYLVEKAWHAPWENEGERLYELVERVRDVTRFCELVQVSAPAAS
jgi:hypothetical protein